MLMISLSDVPKSGQHDHGRRLLRECLRPYGVPEDAAMEKGGYGKPYFRDYPELHFNISHGDGIAACIVTERECGIDCEPCREYRERVARRCFSPAEQRMIVEAAPEERDLLFTRLWTLKEAFVKCIGQGISYPMDTAEFTFDGERIASSPEGYRFAHHIIRGGEYVVSVCIKEKE